MLEKYFLVNFVDDLISKKQEKWELLKSKKKKLLVEE
jgi:hypothetical protein